MAIREDEGRPRRPAQHRHHQAAGLRMGASFSGFAGTYLRLQAFHRQPGVVSFQSVSCGAGHGGLGGMAACEASSWARC